MKDKRKPPTSWQTHYQGRRDWRKSKLWTVAKVLSAWIAMLIGWYYALTSLLAGDVLTLAWSVLGIALCFKTAFSA